MSSLQTEKKNTNLLFSDIALMVGDADLIKQPMQLANLLIDLLGQKAGVHGGEGFERRVG